MPAPFGRVAVQGIGLELTLIVIRVKVKIRDSLRDLHHSLVFVAREADNSV
jgi:hypothetical protein